MRRLGPALGGLLYGTSPSLVYLQASGACLVASGCPAALTYMRN